jgi:hypothetical protein
MHWTPRHLCVHAHAHVWQFCARPTGYNYFKAAHRNEFHFSSGCTKNKWRQRNIYWLHMGWKMTS